MSDPLFQEISALNYMRRPEDVAGYLGISADRVRAVRGSFKICPVCHSKFSRRASDRPSDFAQRQFCKPSCSSQRRFNPQIQIGI